MNTFGKLLSVSVVFVALSAGCSSGSGDNAPGSSPQTMGSISVSITDGPWEEARVLMLSITGMEFGHANGDVIRRDLPGGPMNVDLMQLQNGVIQTLLMGNDIPTGQYEWIRLHLDLSQCYVELAGTGGRHNMQMGPDAINGLEAHEPFQIQDSIHHEFVLEYDVRRGLQNHGMGMMRGQFELHSAMHFIDMDDAGGLMGMVDPSMIDVNYPDCDPAPGGNWAYLFPADTTDPDDVADTNTDGAPGPIATDRVEMDPGSGDHFYHFAYLPPGPYRIAFTCSGEWDEAGDNDYPSDPDGEFEFRMFSGPTDVVAGQMHRFDLMP